MTAPTLVQRALPADLPDVTALLQACNLPSSDLVTSNVELLVLRVAGRLTGTVGLERSGSDALLRSLAVASDARSGGVGHVLLGALESHARRTGIRRLFLLTTDAAMFFERAGYQRVARADVPHTIAATAQFASLCPASATCLAKSLDAS